MAADEQGQFIGYKVAQPVLFALVAAVDPLENTGSETIDKMRDLAVAVKSFGICQVVQQACKAFRHLIGVFRGFLLDLFPALQVPFNERRFSHAATR